LKQISKDLMREFPDVKGFPLSEGKQIKNNLYLTQTDTTIGFVSQDASKIDRAKERLPNKHYIRVVNSLDMLKRFARVPQKHKNFVRRARRTTFIMPKGYSFRVVRSTKHNLLLDRIGWVYSSSANLSGCDYDEAYAKDRSEVIVSFSDKYVGKASKIYRLGEKRIKTIR